MAEDSKGYGKRPLWQWILIYVVIGAIVYFGVYYFFLKPKYSSSGGGYGSNAPSTQSAPSY